MDRIEDAANDIGEIRAMWEDTAEDPEDEEAFEEYLAEREHIGDPESAEEVEANESAADYGGF